MNEPLDVNFYKNIYTDLSIFSSDEQFKNHYENHGRSEGRIPNQSFFF